MAHSTNNVGGMTSLMDTGGDAWDDSELIRAYDKAVKNWRRTRNSDGGEGEETQEAPVPGPWVDVKEVQEAPKKEVPELLQPQMSKLAQRLVDVGSWIVGSPCRAIFSEDGLEYEAKIMGIQGPSCTVRFVGYGNEEQVNLIDLKTTHGKKSRDKQRRVATQYQYGNVGGTSGVDEMDECFSNISLTSSMCNNYTDSVCRDFDETLTDSSVPSRRVFQASTPRSFHSGPGFITKKAFLGVGEALVTEKSDTLPTQVPESVDGGLPSGAEATVDSSSDVSSVEVEDEPEEAGPAFTNGEWENFNNTMPHLRFPVPPMPLSFSNKVGTCDFGRGELPALLMSWYMAGYQAGFFDAKQELSSSTSKFTNQGRNGKQGKNV